MAAADISEAATCPGCGYCLHGLSEHICPECGAPFDPEYVEGGSLRMHLLAWEQPELGGWVVRLVKTLIQASIHPGRFFRSVSKRKEVPIASAGNFVAACMLASLCLYAAAFLLARAIFFLSLLARQARPGQALDTVVRLVNVDWLTELLFPLIQLVPASGAVVLIAALIRRGYPGKLGSLRTLDLAAIHSPAVVIGAFLISSAQVAAAISPNTLGILVVAAFWTQPLCLWLLVCAGCGELLSLSRWKTAGVLIGAVILLYGCASTVVALLWSVMWLIAAL